MSLTKWKRNNGLRPPFESFLDNFWGQDFFGSMATGTTVPAVNIKETEASYEVAVASPGLKKEDFHIDVDHNVLTISAETKEEKEEKDGEKVTRREFSFSSFKRSFSIPDNVLVDEIKANYQDGILSLSLPKKEKTEPNNKKRISIS